MASGWRASTTHIQWACKRVTGPSTIAIDSVVTQTDVSYGADKIIVGPGITSAKHLMGKRVAVLEGCPTRIFMAVWLARTGVKFDQVKNVNVITNLLEPYWLNSAFIADGMYMSDQFLKTRPGIAAKAMKAYSDALEYWKKNPDEANAIIAKGFGLKTSDVKDVIGNDGKPKKGGLAVFGQAGAQGFMGVTSDRDPLDLPNGQAKAAWSLTVEWWR